MSPDQVTALFAEVQNTNAKVENLEKKLDKTINDIKEYKEDHAKMAGRIEFMISRQSVCQARCHVPGPGLWTRIKARLFGGPRGLALEMLPDVSLTANGSENPEMPLAASAGK